MPAPSLLHNYGAISPYIRHRPVADIDVHEGVKFRTNCGRKLPEHPLKRYYWLTDALLSDRRAKERKKN